MATDPTLPFVPRIIIPKNGLWHNIFYKNIQITSILLQFLPQIESEPTSVYNRNGQIRDAFSTCNFPEERLPFDKIHRNGMIEFRKIMEELTFTLGTESKTSRGLKKNRRTLLTYFSPHAEEKTRCCYF